jgi:hypothetical protein
VTRVPQRRPGAPPGDGRGRHEAGPTTAETATATAEQQVARLDGDDTACHQSRAERRGSRQRGAAFQPVSRTARTVSHGGPPRRWYTAGTLARVEQGAAARRELVARLAGGAGRR